MRLELINYGVALAIIALAIYKCKQNKRTLDKMVRLGIVRAEEIFKSGEGKSKLLYVMQQARSSMPKWMNWMLSDSMLKGIIEIALSDYQIAFKGKAPIEDNGEIGFRVNRLLHERFEAEAYAEGSTNFRGDDRVSAGVKVKL